MCHLIQLSVVDRDKVSINVIDKRVLIGLILTGSRSNTKVRNYNEEWFELKMY